MDDKNNRNDIINDIPMRDIFEGVDYDVNTYMTEHEGKELFVIGEGFNHGHALFGMDDFVRKVESSKGFGFKVSKNTKGKTQLEELALGKYFSSLNYWTGELLQYPPDIFTMSPHVGVFADACRELHLMEETFTRPAVIHRPGVTGADLYNTLITCIREKTKTAVFKKRCKASENNYRRNLKSYTGYFNALLNRWSRLLVLRVDLYFPTEPAGFISVEKAHVARENFLNNMRSNSLFTDLKGLIWKLEFGRDRGHHFHFIFMFGAQRKQDEWIGEEIGKYWMARIAPGGSYNNCNKYPNKYKRRGVGEINHDDAQKREMFLVEVLGYLIKQDQCLMVKPSKGRSIGRMEMPKARTSAAGRPRKKAQ